MHHPGGFLKIFFAALMGLVLQGCAAVGYQQFYRQSAPSKYPPTEAVQVFQYNSVDINDVYRLLFSDHLVIGKAAFNGPLEDAEGAKAFAKAIGADLLITSAQLKETRTSLIPLTVPSTSTTQFSGYGAGGFYSGTATTYGTRTTTIPVRVDRYDQTGLFLKDINKVEGWWSYTQDKFTRGKPNQLEGVWGNENYTLDLQGAEGNKVYAFTISATSDRGNWPKGQFKFLFDIDSKKGIYLMGNRTPMPATFDVNRFGFLEVRLVGADEVFSFARK